MVSFRIFFKIFQKKPKNFKAICVVLDYSKPKIFFVGQPWWLTFFQSLPPHPQLFSCYYGPVFTTELEVSSKTNNPVNNSDAEEWKPETSLIVIID